MKEEIIVLNNLNQNDENKADTTIRKESVVSFNDSPSSSIFAKKNRRYDSQLSSLPTTSRIQPLRSNSYHLSHRSIFPDTFGSYDCPDAIPEMSFTYKDILNLVFSIFTFLLDYVLDIILIIKYYYLQNYWRFGLTIAFIAIPSIIMTLMSLRWYIMDSQDPNSMKVSKTRWCIRVILLAFQFAPVIRYIDAMLYGIKFRQLKDSDRKNARKYFLYMIYEDTDATMLRMFECFMETAPQMILHMTILITMDEKGKRTWYYLQSLAMLGSLLAMSWCLVSYLRILRMSLPHKHNMTWMACVIQFFWRFFMIASRVLILSLFATKFIYSIGIVIFIHWVIMLLWILTMKTSFCANRTEEFFYNAVLAVIFIFCYFNPVDNPSRKRYAFFYSIMFVENMTILALWYSFTDDSLWYRLPPFIVYFVSFFVALIFMVIYYLKFHPTQNIKIFSSTQESNGFSSAIHSSIEPSIAVSDPKNNSQKRSRLKHYRKQLSGIWTASGRLLHPRPEV